MRLRSYLCGVRGKPEWERTIIHSSPGKAKYEYLLDIQESWPDVNFPDLTCHVGGPIRTPESFVRVANSRGVPFARCGMAVEVGGRKGHLVGSNDSANFNVLFESGHVENCHPKWEMVYYDDDGSVLADYSL